MLYSKTPSSTKVTKQNLENGIKAEKKIKYLNGIHKD